MKLNLYSSSLNRLSSKACIESLKKFVNTDQKVYVVVPDKASLSTEQNLIELLNIDGYFNFEVVTFNILAETFLQECGRKNLSSFGASMVIKNILNKQKDNFVCFNKSVNNVNFALLMQATISQIKSSNISVENLKQVLQQSTGGLKLKLTDICLVYEEYEKYLQNNFEDGLSKFARLNEELKYNTKIKNCIFAFINFNSFTISQETILTTIIKNSKEVYFGFEQGDKLRKNTIFYNNEIKNMLMRICNILGLPFYVNFVKKQFFSTESFFLNTNLLNFEALSYEKKPIHYSITNTLNIEEELAFIASTIRKGVIESNNNFSDYAVCVCNSENYNDKIKEIFSKWEIPFYLDAKESITDQAICNLVVNILKVFKSDFAMGECLSLFKNYFFGLTGDESSALENYCIKHGVNGSLFFENFKSPEVEILRKKVFDNLYGFYRQFINLKTAGEISNLLITILDNINAKEKSEQLSKLFYKNNNYRGEKLASIACEKVYEILDEIVLSSFEENISIENFINIFLVGVTKNEINLIPLTTNSVFVGDLYESYFKDYKTIFICGATDGYFPKYKMDAGLILDEEIAEMQNLSKLEPSVKVLNERALNCAFSMLFKSEFVYITYPLKMGNESCKSSVLTLNIKNCLKIKENNFILDDIELSFFEGFYPSKEVLKDFLAIGYSDALKGIIKKDSHIISALASILLSEQEKKLFLPSDKLDNANELFFSNNTINVSQLQEWFKCPLSHFFKYGLRLLEQEENKLKSLDIGNIYHLFCYKFQKYLIENYPINESACMKKAQIIIDEILKSDEYVKICEDRSNLHLVLNAKKEVLNIAKALIIHYETSNFKPKTSLLERPFENVNICVDDKNYTLKGKIDRADVLYAEDQNTYVRVIDYKSGEKKFELEKIYYGEQIQLPSYLLSLRKEKLKPAGMFYMPITNIHTKNKFTSKLSGLLRDDINLIKQMDLNLENNSTSLTLPVKMNISGKLSKLSSVTSAKNFDTILDYTTNLMQQSIKEINSGFFRPSILKDNNNFSVCDYCPYFKIGCCSNKHIRDKQKVKMED